MKRKKVIRLTENDLNRIVKKVINEAYEGGIIQQGDVPCHIWCQQKLAKVGSNGDVVKMIQHLLFNGGYNKKYSGGGMTGDSCKGKWQHCDGKFRKHTYDAVLEFQRDHADLTNDGVVGYQTLAKMCEVLSPNQYTSNFTLCERQCRCNDIDIDNDQDDYQDNDQDNDQQIVVDIDCDDLRDCVDKYIFGSTAPDMSGFISCYYKGDSNKKDRPKGDMDENDWRELEMDGFIEGCTWYIRSYALSSGSKKVRSCPTRVDCMPGPGKDMRFCNSKFLQACKSKKCTQVTY